MARPKTKQTTQSSTRNTRFDPNGCCIDLLDVLGYGGLSRSHFFYVYRTLVRCAIPPRDLAPSRLFSEEEVERRGEFAIALARQLNRLTGWGMGIETVRRSNTKRRLPEGVLRFDKSRRGGV